MVGIELHEYCLRCGRKLKSEESKLLGFGKTCWEKYNADDNFKELFPESCLTINSCKDNSSPRKE